MVQDGRLQAMVNRGGCQPSHLMFVDDIFIFCNGNKRSLDNLMGMLGKYQCSSGQVVNRAKSKCFVGGVTDTRKNEIANYLHMDLSAFPDKYFGVILNPGREKYFQVWGMVKMMQQMLAGWMGKLLAFADRLILVKYVLCIMPVYNMSVYKWPKSVIKECEKIIRNFLWSGDPAVKRLVTVKWDEVNSPISEGGLRLRRLEIMNKTLLMKLLWKIETEDVEWTQFMRSKYKNSKNEWITSYKQSSIRPGIKWVIPAVKDGSRWLVAGGKKIYVWKDKWIKDYALIDRYATDPFVEQNKDLKVHHFIVNDRWQIPKHMYKFFEKNEVPVLTQGEDTHIWETDLQGKFSVSSAAQLIRKSTQQLSGQFQCLNPTYFEEVLQVAKRKSGAIKAIWFNCAFNTMTELWHTRNRVIYKDEKQNIIKFKQRIIRFTGEFGVRIKSSKWNGMYDMNILLYFGITGVKTQCTQVKQCHFKLPSRNQILICCDDASKGNPGNAGFGFVAKNEIGDCVGAASGGLGLAINYLAEVMALVMAGVWDM
ncbi:uncharacterized protein LOC113311808 [Papaver somniferum]|uniref:uncharacterized protein LOC113311808 n=1 Tax=Papaver somniferum TaxID=3469 RepID=UPI000E701ADC|nr:uncharacterized protein LOC113311808 [Papaver somniferum]